MVEFNESGILREGLLYSLSIAEFREAFVVSMPKNEIRRSIFDEFTKLIESIRAFAAHPFYILAGGSFVTTKPEPNDLDFVVVLPQHLWDDREIINRLEDQLYQFRRMRTTILHGYFIPDCHKLSSHRLNRKAYAMLVYWMEFFSKSRVDDTGNQHQKGLIKIDIP